MDLRPLISHAALRQRGPNEHNPSKRNLNKSGTMGGLQSRAAAVRTFPPTPARPCPFHHSFIMLMELSLQIQKDLICDCLSAALSCVCLCARVCSRGTAGLTHSILLHFFLSSFFPQSKSSNYAYHFSEKEGATKNLSLSSAERWVYGPCPKQCWISPDVVLLKKKACCDLL